MDAPEKIGLIPSLLQHASAEIGERHYNLAHAIKASQRFAQHRASIKNRLRLIATEANVSDADARACGRPRRKSKLKLI